MQKTKPVATGPLSYPSGDKGAHQLSDDGTSPASSIDSRRSTKPRAIGHNSPKSAARDEAIAATLSPPSIHPESSYDGTEVVYRLMRLGSWGSPLMNLGYFPFSGALAFLNLVAPLERAQNRLVIEASSLLDVQSGHGVLDLACGRGKSSFIIQCLHPQAEVVGLDVVEKHIAVAQTLFGNTGNLSYTVGNAMALDLPDASFDRVMCLEAAFHFSDRAEFLREAYRVLRPGGRLVVVDFAWKTEADRRHRDDPETKLVRQVWQWDDFASVPEYESMAKRAGFRVSAAHDWSPHVTRPIQTQLRCSTFLSRSGFGRKLLCRKIPLYRSLSIEDWRACSAASVAHAHVQKHSKYMAFVFDKPTT